MQLTTQQIADVLKAPPESVAEAWPLIETSMSALCQEHFTDAVRIAALATVRVECPPFHPIKEYGGQSYLIGKYAHRADMGFTGDESALKYCGRGYVQLTGPDNYQDYGRLMDLPLLENPDLALIPANAAGIMAWFFHRTKACAAAGRFDFTKVRRIVNGGHNQLDEFLLLVSRLAAAAGLDAIREAADKQLFEANLMGMTKAAR